MSDTPAAREGKSLLRVQRALRARASCLSYKTRYAVVKGSNLTDIWRHVQRCGPGVRDVHGVSLQRQFIEILLRVWRHQIHPELYYCHRLYLLPSGETPLFIHPNTMFVRHRFLLEALALDLFALKDKRRYHEACRRHGLPTPRVIADFANGEVRWHEEPRLPAVDLFSKEASSGRGAGACNWTLIRPGCWQSQEGGEFGQEALISHLAALSKTAPLLLQVKLRPHPDLADLSPGGCSTARVMTCIEPDGRDCRVFAATFKMLKPGQPTDHWRYGGVASNINLATGELGLAKKRDAAVCHADFDRHPDTGGLIHHRRLPLWDEVVAATTRAHRCFPQFNSLGWDVAMTDAGVVLLEANVTWEARIVQQPGLTPLGRTSYHPCFLNWHRIASKRACVLPGSPYFHGWRSCLRAASHAQHAARAC